MSFFDVFSGAPYGSDFLILTKEIIKKVPKRSAKKYLDYSNSGADRIIQASFSTHLCRFVFIFSKFYLIFFSYQIIRVKIEPVQTIFSALIFPISITHPVE